MSAPQTAGSCIQASPSECIRTVRDGDGLAIAALIAGCFAEYPGCIFDWEEFPELRAPATWAASRGTRMWVLASASGPVVGCICGTPDGPDCVELHKFYLASHLRGSGMALRLAAEVLALARDHGAGHVRLWTDTRFTRAHRFYEKLGFVRQPGQRALGDLSNSIEHEYHLSIAAGR